MGVHYVKLGFGGQRREACQPFFLQAQTEVRRARASAPNLPLRILSSLCES